MSKVLVISGHPDLSHSFTNRVILGELEEAIDGLRVRRLDQRYPDTRIDVAAEQQALLEADILVLQFPFYWYSVPALLKKWIDEVLTFNFAFGPEGDKLKGKPLLISLTVGGPQESYRPLGYNHFTIPELLKPLEQLAYLTGMPYEPPIWSHGMVYIPEVYNTLELVEARARDHASRLIAVIRELQQVN
ncbi:NAD(P)H-dependent oxidoreductase [Aeromonas veronii]